MSLSNYLKDYYSNNSNNSFLDQIKNYGSEAGGGKAFLNGIANGVSDVVRLPAKGFASMESSLASKLTGKDRSQENAIKQQQIDDFFKIDALQESVNQYPTIDSIANFGTAMIGGNALLKAPSGIARAGGVVDTAINKSISNEQLKNNSTSFSNIGANIANGIGSVIKQPIKAITHGNYGLTEYLTGKDLSAKKNNDLQSIDNFFTI